MHVEIGEQQRSRQHARDAAAAHRPQRARVHLPAFHVHRRHGHLDRHGEHQRRSHRRGGRLVENQNEQRRRQRSRSHSRQTDRRGDEESEQECQTCYYRMIGPALMRLVILHYHIFKNAGSTIEDILDHSFGERFASWTRPPMKD